MKRIEKLLEKELASLIDEKERSFFRGEMESFYKNFKNKMEMDMRDIENIVDNYFDNVGEFPIYTIPIHEKDVLEYSDELKIMCPKNFEHKTDYEKIVVEEILLMVEEEEILKKTSKKYKGTISFEKEKYNLKIRLEKVRKYEKKEKELYEAFVINGIRWNPFIMPYNNKFYNIVVHRRDNPNLDDKIIQKITKDNVTYDLEIFEGKYYRNYCLMWNVSESKIISEGYTVSQMEDNMYVHQVTVQKNGLTMIRPDKRNNLYNIELGNNFKIFIRTKLRQIDTWTVMNVKRLNNEGRYKEEKFVLISNIRNRNMINRLRYRYKNRIRSELEIYRISGMYTYLNEIKLKRVEIKEDRKGCVEIRNRYGYIDNEIMESLEKFKEKKKLVLTLKYPKNMKMKEDKLSYYVSVIQFFFPEYECLIRKEKLDE